jgi:hypothetical protein
VATSTTFWVASTCSRHAGFESMATSGASSGTRRSRTSAPIRFVLLRQVRPEADATVLAHLLLAPFVPSLLEHLVVDGQLTPERIKAGIDDLLHG